MKNEFQYRLQKCIADKGISMAELSRISGINKVAISNYIKGIYLPKQDKCYLLARALNVDPGWLMTGEEPLRSDDLQNLIDELDESGALDIIDIYSELNEEHRKDAKKYLLFLKSQETDNG